MNSKTSPSEAHDNDALNLWPLLRNLPEAHLLLDAATPDFRIVELNKAREKLSGVRRDAVLGRPLLEVFPGINKESRQVGIGELYENISEVVQTGKPKRLDAFRYDRWRNGSLADVRYWQLTYQPVWGAYKKVRYVLSTARDVTDQVHAARRAQSLEDRLQAALEVGKVGSWTWDLETNIITGDKNLARLFNLNKRQVLQGVPLGSLMHAIYPEDRPQMQAAIEASLTRHIPFNQECRLVLEGGVQRWVLARGKIEEHDGKEILPGVVVDITERRDLQAQIAQAHQQDELNRRAAEILQQRNEELVAIGRSKDEFVALASHQLRTPATAVKQYLGMVLQGYAGDITDMQADMLEKAFESNERQIQIVNQILNAARADTGRLVMAPIPLDLCALVRGVWNDMGVVFSQHGHRCNLNVPAQQVWVMADQSYLRMAFENVLYNACIYTPDGGTITATLSRFGSRCRLSVADTGVGIRKADFSKLFAKFSRIHNPLSVQAGGSGIGLYLTSEIVRLHNGIVNVESKLHRGTTFAILLPLMQNKNQDERKAG